jgi:hypothetical protein
VKSRFSQQSVLARHSILEENVLTKKEDSKSGSDRPLNSSTTHLPLSAIPISPQHESGRWRWWTKDSARANPLHFQASSAEVDRVNMALRAVGSSHRGQNPSKLPRRRFSLWSHILTLQQGFDEFMNLVIDDAVEVQQATKTQEEKRRQLGWQPNSLKRPQVVRNADWHQDKYYSRVITSLSYKPSNEAGPAEKF